VAGTPKVNPRQANKKNYDPDPKTFFTKQNKKPVLIEMIAIAMPIAYIFLLQLAIVG